MNILNGKNILVGNENIFLSIKGVTSTGFSMRNGQYSFVVFVENEDVEIDTSLTVEGLPVVKEVEPIRD